MCLNVMFWNTFVLNTQKKLFDCISPNILVKLCLAQYLPNVLVIYGTYLPTTKTN